MQWRWMIEGSAARGSMQKLQQAKYYVRRHDAKTRGCTGSQRHRPIALPSGTGLGVVVPSSTAGPDETVSSEWRPGHGARPLDG